MKRIYRVTIVVERAFERKATAAAKAIRDKLVRLAEAQILWTVTRTSITNRAVRERRPRSPSEPDPAKVYEDIAAGQALATLREIVADMAAILGNVKKPRLEFAPNRWCDGKFTHNVAHAHISNGVRWIRGPRAGRKIPKGLICISRRKLLAGHGWAAPSEWPKLMAHELMHVRMPGGSHKRAKFRENVERLLGLYAAYRMGAITLPARSIRQLAEDAAMSLGCDAEPRSVLDIDDGRRDE